MGDRVLVTGCNGFVGKHLCSVLAGTGYEVVGLDHAPHSAVGLERYVSVDIADQRETAEAVNASRPSAVYHLAAVANPRIAERDPRRAYDVNVTGTMNVIAALSDIAHARLLVVGTSHVYSVAGNRPLSEQARVSISNVYAATKYAAEVLSLRMAASSSVDIVCTRSFNHIGVGQSSDYVLSSFARQCAEVSLGLRSPLIRVGSLEIERDFLDVEDTADAYIALVREGCSSAIYNVCSGRTFLVRALLDQLIEQTDLDITVEVDQELVRANDPPKIVGDNTKIKRDTGWSPSRDVPVTVERMYEEWRKLLAAQRSEQPASVMSEEQQ